MEVYTVFGNYPHETGGMEGVFSEKTQAHYLRNQLIIEHWYSDDMENQDYNHTAYFDVEIEEWEVK